MNKTDMIRILGLASMTVALVSCTIEEDLNLSSYPAVTVSATVGNSPAAPVQEFDICGTYDSAGDLVLDQALPTTFTVYLSTVSPYDMSFHVEPVLNNLSSSDFSLVGGARTVTIPAGDLTTVFEFEISEDFSPDSGTAADSYGYGIAISAVEGYHIEADMTEAVVTVDKEAYVAALALNESDVAFSFKRSWMNGEILETEDISADFGFSLSRPASQDITLSFSTSGVATSGVVCENVVIPAGEVSAIGTWTITKDFLLETSEADEWTVTVTPSFSSGDSTVQWEEGTAREVTIDISKVIVRIGTVDALPSDWVEIDKSGWSISKVSGSSIYSISKMIDGSTSTYGYAYGSFVVEIDLGEECDICGFYTYTSTSWRPKSENFQLSSDGENWTDLGTVTHTDSSRSRYFKADDTYKARYVRYSPEEIVNYIVDIYEISVYSPN